MQRVNVLGDDFLQKTFLLQGGKGQVGWIGLGVEGLAGQRPEPVKKTFGMAAKGAKGGNLKRVNAGP